MTLRHLYVHVPLCARRCSYCDFAIAVRRVIPVDEYVGALSAEVAARAGERGDNELDTLYLGGGTPSLLGTTGISNIVKLATRYFGLSSTAEVTIEANPDDVTPEAARSWLASGVNRVSLGVQSFDDRVLGWMHRTHDSAQAIAAVRHLRNAGFDNISVDLIFALPESLERSWSTDLSRALDLEPDHISLYGLTIEPATPLARWKDRGTVSPAGEDRYAEDFLLAGEFTRDRGYEHYEVSNFARGGKRSRHNSAYWSGAEYLGAGPSAHSFDAASRTWNIAPYAAWVASIRERGTGVEGTETLTSENRLAERVYLGLRTKSGLAVAGSDLEVAAGWARQGWAKVTEGIVRLTPEGWLRLDSLAASLTGS
ncbi:MAG: radical SAM family heme chaperone HemW [Gemmatimonadaceae bacterium]